jgi:hypothetical protein
MGIRQLPSGAFQVRFQHDRAAYVATYPTRELAEEAEPQLRAVVLTRQPDDHDEKEVVGQTSLDRASTPTCTPSPGAVPGFVGCRSTRDRRDPRRRLARGRRPGAGVGRGADDLRGGGAAGRVPPDGGVLARGGPDPVRVARHAPARPPIRRPHLPRSAPAAERHTAGLASVYGAGGLWTSRGASPTGVRRPNCITAGQRSAPERVCPYTPNM